MNKIEAVTTSKQLCDLCRREAKYDGKTKMGPWAYMCEEHFRQFGIGLGSGKGQRLNVKKA